MEITCKKSFLATEARRPFAAFLENVGGRQDAMAKQKNKGRRPKSQSKKGESNTLFKNGEGKEAPHRKAETSHHTQIRELRMTCAVLEKT